MRCSITCSRPALFPFSLSLSLISFPIPVADMSTANKQTLIQHSKTQSANTIAVVISTNLLAFQSPPFCFQPLSVLSSPRCFFSPSHFSSWNLSSFSFLASQQDDYRQIERGRINCNLVSITAGAAKLKPALRGRRGEQNEAGWELKGGSRSCRGWNGEGNGGFGERKVL